MGTGRRLVWSLGAFLAALAIAATVLFVVLPPLQPPPTLWRLDDGGARAAQTVDDDLRAAADGTPVRGFERVPVQFLGIHTTTRSPDILVRHAGEFSRDVYETFGQPTEWWYGYAGDSVTTSDGKLWRRYERHGVAQSRAKPDEPR